jgi:trehalose synthase
VLREVHIGAEPLQRYIAFVDEALVTTALSAAVRVRESFAGRAVWNVSSTSTGGGVAEMLASLLPYVRGAGVDGRWIVVQGDRAFFRITKRLHNALHGESGDGSPLGDAERRHYDKVLQQNAIELAEIVRPGDVVIAHDPQTAGLIPFLSRHHALTLWRCHVGYDRPSPDVEAAWEFLAPYLRAADAFVFSHERYAPPYLDRARVFLVHPTIDPFSLKNQPLDDEVVRSILATVGIVEGPAGGEGRFTREDGSPGRVDRPADIMRVGGPPSWETPLVVQVSRWDRLKDPLGVMSAFTRLLVPDAPRHAELVLAGPDVRSVTDDPEGLDALDETVGAWRTLPLAERRRIHIVSLPMADVAENAVVVNALQRHAAVLVQKSLREGFGLTVTEAMWKARPLVASAVGGIPVQVRDGVDGLLVHDPRNLDEAAAALARLLREPALASRLAESAHQRAGAHFLGIHALVQYASLLEKLNARAGDAAQSPRAGT